jgi:hypothetical protein
MKTLFLYRPSTPRGDPLRMLLREGLLERLRRRHAGWADRTILLDPPPAAFEETPAWIERGVGRRLPGTRVLLNVRWPLVEEPTIRRALRGRGMRVGVRRVVEHPITLWQAVQRVGGATAPGGSARARLRCRLPRRAEELCVQARVMRDPISPWAISPWYRLGPGGLRPLLGALSTEFRPLGLKVRRAGRRLRAEFRSFAGAFRNELLVGRPRCADPLEIRPLELRGWWFRDLDDRERLKRARTRAPITGRQQYPQLWERTEALRVWERGARGFRPVRLEAAEALEVGSVLDALRAGLRS